jgi:hypothetical protein
MNRSLLSRILVFASLLSLTLWSCEPDEVNPAVDRSDYIGTWNGQSDGPVGGQISFILKITASNSSPDGILLENFDGLGQGTFIPAVVDAGTVTIPRCISASDTIEGYGNYLNNGTLTFNFTVRDGQSVDERTATATKQ